MEGQTEILLWSDTQSQKPSLFQDCLQSVGVAPKASAEDLIVFTPSIHLTHHIDWFLPGIFDVDIGHTIVINLSASSPALAFF